MKTINITQLPLNAFSHPNYALDLAGEDTGRDVWRAQGCWKSIAVFGNIKTGNTRLFFSCNEKGNPEELYLADGTKSVITLALTHSMIDWPIGKIFRDGEVMYNEGTSGKATGNHIHMECAKGIQETKYYDKKLGVYRMNNEVNPLDVCFVRDDYSTVAMRSLGKDKLKHCKHLDHAIQEFPGAVYRLYNPHNGEHMYTAMHKEAQALYEAGWIDEGIAWMQGTGAAVYRLYEPVTGHHLWTMDKHEVKILQARKWKYEGIAFATAESDKTPVFRLYNRNDGTHFYTANPSECTALIDRGWKCEGVAFYGG